MEVVVVVVVVVVDWSLVIYIVFKIGELFMLTFATCAPKPLYYLVLILLLRVDVDGGDRGGKVVL